MSAEPEPQPQPKQATDADVRDAIAEADGVNRRGFLKRIGLASGTVVTLGAGGSKVAPRYSPVGRARAAVPIGVVGYYAGVAAVGYLAGNEAYDIVTGDDRDYSGYTGADALHQEIVIGAKDMRSADERVMTGIQNNITNSQNVALAKGKAAIIEKMNAGAAESEAQTAMQDAIDGYYATIQENILNHWNAQLSKIHHFWEQLDTHSNISPQDVIDHREEGHVNNPRQPALDNAEYGLLNGDSVTIHQVARYNSNDADVTRFGPDHDRSFDFYAVIDRDGGWNTLFVTGDYGSTLSALESERDTVNSELSGFVADVYSQYEPGDIPTEDLVDPITASTELRQNYDNRSGQSAHAAMLGIPTTAEHTAQLEIVSQEAEDGVWEVTADIFTEYVPTVDVSDSASISSGVLTLSKEPVSNSTYELTTTDSETVEFASSDLSDNGDGTWEIDLSGDLSTTSTSVDTLLEEDEFKTGNTYQPSNWSKPLYIAYNYVDETTGEEKGAFTQIESEFTIVEVTDANGNSVDSFRTRSRNNQTSDVAALEDELQQLREEWIKMQEEAQDDKEEDDGWTFPPLFEGGGGGGLLLLAGGVLAFLGLQNNN